MVVVSPLALRPKNPVTMGITPLATIGNSPWSTKVRVVSRSTRASPQTLSVRTRVRLSIYSDLIPRADSTLATR